MDLFVDIETIPVGGREEVQLPSRPTADMVKIGNLKDEAKIDAKIKEQMPLLVDKWKEECDKIKQDDEKRFRDRALIHTQNEIICLCYAIDDEDPVAVKGGNEGEILINFEKELDIELGHSITTAHWIGFNIGWDIAKIRIASFKYGINTFKRFPPIRGQFRAVVDLCNEFINPIHPSMYKGSKSMAEITKYLGIESKSEMDGSQVYDFYLRGELDKIREYCKEDVRAAQQTYRLMTPDKIKDYGIEQNKKTD